MLSSRRASSIRSVSNEFLPPSRRASYSMLAPPPSNIGEWARQKASKHAWLTVAFYSASSSLMCARHHINTSPRHSDASACVPTNLYVISLTPSLYPCRDKCKLLQICTWWAREKDRQHRSGDSNVFLTSLALSAFMKVRKQRERIAALRARNILTTTKDDKSEVVRGCFAWALLKRPDRHNGS